MSAYNTVRYAKKENPRILSLPAFLCYSNMKQFPQTVCRIHRKDDTASMDKKIFIKNLAGLCHIPISIYQDTEGLTDRLDPLGHPLNEYEHGLIDKILQRLHSVPFAYETYEAGLPVCIMGCRGSNCSFILGPFAYSPIRTPDLEGRLRKLRLHLDSFVECSWNGALNAAVFLINEYRDPHFTIAQLEENILEKKHDVQHLLINEEIRQWESFQENHTYNEENIVHNYVEKGDVDYLINNLELMELPHPVILSDFYKNEEYMAVLSISFAARAAIRGGVTSKEGLLTNDIYLKQLEDCKNVNEIKLLTRRAMLHFAQLVRKKQNEQSKNMYVEKCKRAIYVRIQENIDLQKLADQLGISKEYMLKLFKKQEGIPVTKYIQNVKIEAACNMLIYSDRQINEISEYLGFASLSYFSRIFKTVTGMSPIQYRKIHAHPDF